MQSAKYLYVSAFLEAKSDGDRILNNEIEFESLWGPLEKS